MDVQDKFRALLTSFMQAASSNIELYASRKIKLDLPEMPKSLIIKLINAAKSYFQVEPTLLDIESPCTIIGDLHGHVLDLFRILKTEGLPNQNPKNRFVFLGDLVDRGEFSVHTIVIVYLLKVLWPDKVFIIRGNHEFDFMASQGGFQTQVNDEFSDNNIYNLFLDSFSHLPLSIRIDNSMICVHGGIGPSMFSVKQLFHIQKPFTEFGDEIIDALLWSDPSDSVEHFKPSSRGTGYFFSESALCEFLDLSNLDILIRGHECVMEGCEEKFGNRCITVFSASNYCGTVNNQSAVLRVTQPKTYEIVRFEPLDYLIRYIDFEMKFSARHGMCQSSASYGAAAFPQLKNINNNFAFNGNNLACNNGSANQSNIYGGNNQTAMKRGMIRQVGTARVDDSEKMVKQVPCASSFRYLPKLNPTAKKLPPIEPHFASHAKPNAATSMPITRRHSMY
ncbi:Ser/Thr protein phosphatase [Tritrichomonas foetus]|uniref:Serine/threonine-protein phosphatase n=1 Tax=Tritrichomonas foetus TaxID=1144522 RepID=A0A1J4KRZ9_9EUKA|nr:Ser/Thr protein phosphatase [Tritrichomonas foetus]|eukprot:OHT12596.1 Ser/Thr protein phosphatase [Tritrichomonas foetus]